MDATLERLKAPPAPQERARGGRRVVAGVAAAAVLAIATFAETLAGAFGSGGVARIGLAALWAAAGVVLVLARPRERMGVVTLVAAAVGAVAALAVAAAAHLQSSAPAEAARWLALCALPPAALQVVLSLPDGRLVKRSRRLAVPAFYAAGVVLGIAQFLTRPAPLWPVLVFAAVALAAGAGWSSARYRRSAGIERQRMQWFGLAFTVGLGVAAVAGGLRLLVGWPADGVWVAAVATAPIPLSLAMGASPRMVARVDRLLAHTVSLAGLTGVVVLAYLVIVIGLGRVPGREERTLLALSMLAAMVAALLYLPMRERLQRLAVRIVYGDRRPPEDMLKTFGTKIFSRAFPLDELMLQLCESLRRSFDLDAAEVWTGGEGTFERSVSDPERPSRRLTLGPKEQPVVARAGVSGPAWLRVWMPELLEGRADKLVRVAPIVHAGELLGMIVIEKRQTEEVFDEEKERVLAELARTCGVALHNVKLDSALQASLDELKRQAEDLRLSRQRIVTAGDAERRKIERNIHDGAQQHLVALKVKLRLVQQLADRDPDAAKTMLDQISNDVQDTIQELRDLSHGIYPPLLADRGLVAALEAAAARQPLPTSVEAGDVNRHAPELESAVYFCCLEALQNAAKHAGSDAAVTIRLREEEGALLFEVADTGAGFDMSQRGLGIGFVNMRDRVGAVGGTLDVESSPGRGTSIRGRLPLAG